MFFADLVGFTSRSERLDPEDVRATLSPYYSLLRSELERYGGTVEKFIGDAVMALFGAPITHEDDPERAVRAAFAIRDAVAGPNEDDLKVRIAINTGEALVALGAHPGEGEGMAAGDVVNTAARMQAAAPVNGILVDETTYQVTKQHIEYRKGSSISVRGKTNPVAVWEAVQPLSRLGVDALIGVRQPMAGRQAELRTLSTSFGQTAGGHRAWGIFGVFAQEIPDCPPSEPASARDLLARPEVKGSRPSIMRWRVGEQFLTRTEACPPASNRLYMRRIAAISVALLFALPGRGCEASGVALARRLHFFRVPPEILRACHRAQREGSFRVLCPARLPHATVGYPSSPPPPLTARVLRDRGMIVGIEFGYGAPYPRGQSRNHPGRFLHLAILRGDVAVGRPPEGSTPLGAGTVAGRDGKLFQAPLYSNSRWGAYHGNHLIFTWRERGVAYTISLHSWRRREALQLLGRVIESLRPVRALPAPQRPTLLPGVAPIPIGDPSSLCFTCLAVNGGLLWAAEYYVGVHRLDIGRGEIIGKPVDVKRFPSGIAVGDDSAWVVGSTKWVDRIDARTGELRATIPVGVSPSAVAVGDNYVWVASYEGGSLIRIDPGTNKEVGQPIRVGGGLNSIAISDGAVWVTDFDGGRILRVDESTGEIVAEMPGGHGLSGIASTPEAIWVTDWARDELLRVDPAANRVVAKIPMGPTPAGVAAKETSVWVTDYWDGTVRSVDAATNEVTHRIGGMTHPTQIAASGDRIVVLDVGSGSIVLIPIRDIVRRGDDGQYGWVLVAAVALGFGAFAIRRRRRPSRRPRNDSSLLDHDQ